MRKFITSLTAVATVTLAAVPALGLLQAAHAAQPVTATGYIGDLDRNDSAQAAEFRARTDAQAQTVCRQIADRTSGSRFGQEDCMRQIRVDVRRQLSSTQRTALRHAAATPQIQVAAR